MPRRRNSRATTMSSTLTLAQFVAQSRIDAIPESALHEGERAIVNWLGCALGGSTEPALDAALAALGEFAGPAQATVLGRALRTDLLTAALANGLGSNLLGVDDTHLETVIHPSVPIASALLPLAEARGASGEAFLHAFVLGVEVACRAGLAVTPAHYEGGWHITATCGVLGAAAACARLLGLDADRTACALGIAATQASGLNEMMGSQSKSLNMGFAARNGLTSALLAERGFTSSMRALEAPRGFVQVLGRSPRPEALTAGLGSAWEIERNAYKPWPCGIVLHPVLDACLQLRNAHAVKPAAIAKVTLRVHPLVLVMTGRTDPTTGLEGKLSVYHSVAVAFVDGAAGVRQYTDERVHHPRVTALRERVEVATDPAVALEEAYATLELTDGRRLERHVRCALGSLERPMTDADLCAKFRELAEGVLATDPAERLLALAWNLRSLGDAGALARGTVPEDTVTEEPPGSPLLGR